MNLPVRNGMGRSFLKNNKGVSMNPKNNDSIKTPPDVMQLVWSDECGKFPWELGCAYHCIDSQMILNK